MMEGEGLYHDGGKLLNEYKDDGISQQPAEIFHAGQGLVQNVIGFTTVEGHCQIGTDEHHQHAGRCVNAVGDIEHVDEETGSKGDEVLNPSRNFEGQHQQCQKVNGYADAAEKMNVAEHKNLCQKNEYKAQYVGAGVIHL